MLQIKGQIDEVDRQIKDAIEEIRGVVIATYRTARSQEAALKKKLEGAKQELLDLQGRNIRYSILKREVDTNRTLYDGLLQRLKEVGIAGGVGINNISVVDKAKVPLAPFKPNLAQEPVDRARHRVAPGARRGLAHRILRRLHPASRRRRARDGCRGPRGRARG